MSEQMIVIKPHHYLDVIKLYGAGLESFVPDEAFGHDFYRVGNLILQQPDLQMQLTRNADDICAPCKYVKDGQCSDATDSNSLTDSKEQWNQTIDARIMEVLGVGEGSQMTSKEFCQLASQKLSSMVIGEIWKEQPKEMLTKRIDFLRKGMEKYLAKGE